MKLLIAIILMSSTAFAKCEKSQHMAAVGKFVTKQSPKGSMIGIKPLKDSLYSYTADLEDSVGKTHESGTVEVKDVKGECVVESRQHQSQSQSSSHSMIQTQSTRPASK